MRVKADADIVQEPIVNVPAVATREVASQEQTPTSRLSRIREIISKRVTPATRVALAAIVATFLSAEEAGNKASVFTADVPKTNAIAGIGQDAVWSTIEQTKPSVASAAIEQPAASTIEKILPKVVYEEAVVQRTAPDNLSPVQFDMPPQSNTAMEDPLPQSSSGVDQGVTETVVDVDPKSPAYQETIVPAESGGSRSTTVEVLQGDEATYPDRAIDPLLATVDSTGIPEVLASRFRAEEKEAFLADATRLKAAGVGSGQRNVTFPGEKINYHDPVERLDQRFNEYRQYLKVPHTEVAEAGDNLTQLVAKSFARDLAVLSEGDRLPVVEEALAAYLATPGALDNLKLTDKDMVPAGAVVPLQMTARYLADAVAKKVLATYDSASTSGVLVKDSPVIKTSAQEVDIISDTVEESGSASEAITDAVTSPENYPGGILEYSKAYNEKLESLGIAPKASAMIDSWFTPRVPDNRALLAMSVGELTKIMMQALTEVARELEVRKISFESAKSMYDLIIKARAEGQAPYEIDSTLTGEEVIRARVLAEATTKSN
ncbi:MAG: hypothetical protein RLZZ360_822 [Candidatus Parcubacteria bacterium]|jgi:hypothetical protein